MRVTKSKRAYAEGAVTDDESACLRVGDQVIWDGRPTLTMHVMDVCELTYEAQVRYGEIRVWRPIEELVRLEPFKGGRRQAHEWDVTGSTAINGRVVREVARDYVRTGAPSDGWYHWTRKP